MISFVFGAVAGFVVARTPIGDTVAAWAWRQLGRLRGRGSRPDLDQPGN